MIWFKRLVLFSIIAAVGAALAYSFIPQPVRVDVAQVESGHLEVSVRDEGFTRVRERYVISTPIGGRLRRIEFDPGDEVIAGKTVLARVENVTPELLDPRERARSVARVAAAKGRVQRADAEKRQAQDALDQAKVDLDRYLKLGESGATTDSQVEQAQLGYRTRLEAMKAAESMKEISEFELAQENAALLHVTSTLDGSGDNQDFEIISPITGRVLKLQQESSVVVAPGTPLLDVGDPTELEVITDILSSDAVRVRPTQRVFLEHWGGDEPLRGIVRLIEPSGFTKYSALGVEEQRVNVIIDFTDSFSKRQWLADGFRVEARIVVWEADDVVKTPTGALFRKGDSWAVFVVENGKASLRLVKIGENNGVQAQVLEGLKPGETVIIHPGDQVADQAPVVSRDA